MLPPGPERSNWESVLGQPPVAAVPYLLGALLRTDGVAVRIVEVEAYGGHGADAASHAHRGPTDRTAPMFGPPGHIYVYLSYGIHRCVNIVAHVPGASGGVLLRAAEIVAGEELARLRRGGAPAGPQLASGPGRLGQVLGVDLADSGSSLVSGPVRLPDPPRRMAARLIQSGPRIGISKNRDLPWRFWVAGNPAVSRARPRGADPDSAAE